MMVITASVKQEDMDLLEQLNSSLLRKPVLHSVLFTELSDYISYCTPEHEEESSDLEMSYPRRDVLEELLSLGQNGFLDDISYMAEDLAEENSVVTVFSGIIKG